MISISSCVCPQGPGISVSCVCSLWCNRNIHTILVSRRRSRVPVYACMHVCVCDTMAWGTHAVVCLMRSTFYHSPVCVWEKGSEWRHLWVSWSICQLKTGSQRNVKCTKLKKEILYSLGDSCATQNGHLLQDQCSISREFAFRLQNPFLTDILFFTDHIHYFF